MIFVECEVCGDELAYKMYVDDDGDLNVRIEPCSAHNISAESIVDRLTPGMVEREPEVIRHWIQSAIHAAKS